MLRSNNCISISTIGLHDWKQGMIDAYFVATETVDGKPLTTIRDLAMIYLNSPVVQVKAKYGSNMTLILEIVDSDDKKYFISVTFRHGNFVYISCLSLCKLPLQQKKCLLF